jgi:hypothetical protein
LFLASISVEVDEEGVTWLGVGGDWTGAEAALGRGWEGDDVPELDSLFLDDLFGSLARESCSC